MYTNFQPNNSITPGRKNHLIIERTTAQAHRTGLFHLADFRLLAWGGGGVVRVSRLSCRVVARYRCTDIVCVIAPMLYCFGCDPAYKPACSLRTRRARTWAQFTRAHRHTGTFCTNNIMIFHTLDTICTGDGGNGGGGLMTASNSRNAQTSTNANGSRISRAGIVATPAGRQRFSHPVR